MSEEVSRTESGDFPKLINIEEFASLLGFSYVQAYLATKKLPAGVVVRLGKKILLNQARLQEWIAAGGSVA